MSLPDPPSARVRRVSSTPRRRSSDPQPRRREDDHKPANSPVGAFLTVLIAVLFLGYVFNLGGFATAADSFFSSLDASAKSQNSAVVTFTTMALPLVGLFVGALILFAVVRFVIRGAKSSSKQRRLAKRDIITLDQFKHITGERGIRPRIATQGYHLLLPFYQSSMRARMDDRLREDLHMTHAQVQDVLGNLLRNTDRKAKVGGPEEPILTVMDLLSNVQNATRQSLMDSVVRSVAPSRSANRPTTSTLRKQEDELAASR